MSTNTGTANSTVAAQYTGPDTGLPLTKDLVNAFLLAIANDVATLDALRGLTPGTQATNRDWLITVSGGGMVAGPANATVEAGEEATQTLDFPDGVTISAFRTRIAPGSHGGSYPPGAFPKIEFFRVNATTGVGAGAALYTVTDAPVSQVAYETPHDLTLTFGAPVTIDRTTYTYYVKFSQESAANSVLGQIQAGRITVDAP